MAALALLGACATTTPSTRAPGRERVKLAVLPIESDAQPRLAELLNQRLREVRLPRVDDYFISKVTLEVAQLSIECVEPTPACYAAVGKSLAAQQLLFGTVTGGRRGDRKNRGIKVSVTVFDVASQAPARTAERQFKNASEAEAGFAALMDELAGGASATMGGAR